MDRRKAETKLQREIKEALEECGYLVRRVQSGGTRVKRGYMHFAEKGTADLIVQGKRFTAWLEAKTEDGFQSDEQEMFEHEVNKRQGYYLIARTVHEAVEQVRALGEAA